MAQLASSTREISGHHRRPQPAECSGFPCLDGGQLTSCDISTVHPASLRRKTL